MTTSTSSPAESYCTQVKLPQITLPTFSGDYLKWVQFKDLFEHLIHNQPISQAEKMFYLVSNVSGDARALIQHLPVCNENYEAAWSSLTHRYDNKRLLTTALLNKFLTLSTQQYESASNIKTLHDTTKECLTALTNLGLDTSTWDPIIVHLLITKLDKTTHALYEQSLKSPRELDTLNNLLNFLEARFQALKTLGGKHQTQKPKLPTYTKPNSFVIMTSNQQLCILCKQNHALYACKEFLSKSPANRQQVLKNHKLCLNCMKSGHIPANCTLRGCTKCSKKHNTLVHIEEGERKPAQENANKLKQGKAEISMATRINTSNTSENKSTQKQVLLSTVRVTLKASDGKKIECRAVLDCGSQINLITERLAKLLKLKIIQDSVSIRGIGKISQFSQQRFNVPIESKTNGFKVKTDAFVIPQITTSIPNVAIDIRTWPIPKNIELADPEFHQPGPIELLIGAEIYYDLLARGQIKLGKGLPTLQNTVFGWIVSGKVDNMTAESEVICTKEEDKLDEQIERFWKLEEVENTKPALSPAELKCEAFFLQTTKRNDKGQLIRAS